MAAPANLWRNWGRTQQCAPVRVEQPASDVDLSRLVKAAAANGETVKVVGAGHSFTDIACTNGVQVRLDGYDRILAVDRDTNQVKVQAGITIADLNRRLQDLGLALENLGDIAYQTISGAISTATHGTGRKLGGIATQVVALELITADGSVVSCSPTEEPEVFQAARVGLGALGVISTVTLQCVPAFNLRAVEKAMYVDRLLDEIDSYVDGNEHFEFFWVPHTSYAITKRNNRTDEPATGRGRWREVRDKVLFENVAFGLACRVGRRWPRLVPKVATAVPGSGKIDYVDLSWKIFASPRWVRFAEMEYAVPRAEATNVLHRLMQLIDDTGLLVSFPVEVRFTAADDIWLSTANGRETCYIAIHMFQGVPYEQYFRGFEAIVDEVGGRPHWGKLHYQTAATLRPRYEHWDDFIAVRNRLDPDGRFANAYLDRVLGPVSG